MAIDSYSDAKTGEKLPDGTATEALADISAYEQQYQKWESRGKQIIKRYRDERSEASNLRVVTRKFNILWSNTETLKPTLYARLPRVQVERRFKDADPVGKTACEIAERAGNYLLEVSPFDNCLRLVVQDLLLPGRGTVWINYRAELSEPEQPIDSDKDEGRDASQEGYEGPNDTDEPGQEVATTQKAPQESELEKIREMIEPIYVDWRDFGHSPKRTWQEVTRCWRITYMTRKQLIDRFGEELGQKIPLDKRAEDAQKNTPDSLHDTASIYEIWDKLAKRVCWACKTEKDYLDEVDPPVDLQEFWPFPRPVWATLTNDTLVPVPFYVLYQDQAAELDKITNRIGRFSDGLKLAGVCDASVPELTRLLSPNGTPDNILIPVANFAAMQEKGGIGGSVQLLPLQDIASTLLQLYQARDQILQVIYQVTGIADIIRGSSNPNETATAQSIKGQFASLRIKDLQSEVARFARDAARIVVEIAVEMYEPETLYEMVQADQFTQLTPREQQMAQMQAQFAQATGQARPPPPKPMEEFAKALRMLRDDKMRSFHVDIETDSTIAMNEQEDKQNVTEFLGALGQFMQGFGPMIQEMPALAPVMGEALLYATRRYKAGRTLEASITKAVDQMVQAAQQPKPDPKAQAEQQKLQLQSQTDQAKIAADSQNNQQKLVANQALEQQKLEAQDVQHQREMQFKSTQAAEDRAQERAKFEAELKQQRELELAKIAAQNNPEGEVAVADKLSTSINKRADAQKTVGEHLKNVHEVMGQVAKALHAASAPKVVVRDEQGRVSGVRVLQ